MRVLLVEDDELLGDGIRTGLKHYGHTVDWVKDGQSANNVLVSSLRGSQKYSRTQHNDTCRYFNCERNR